MEYNKGNKFRENKDATKVVSNEMQIFQDYDNFSQRNYLNILYNPSGNSNLRKGIGLGFHEDNLINSSVVNTGINDCSFKCLSFDQIIESVDIANAKKSTSSGSEINFFDFFKNSLYSDSLINSIESSICFNLELNSCSDNFDLSKQIDLCFLNSDFINFGAINLGFKDENKKEAVDFGFIKENSILLSNTIFIYNNPLFSSSFALPFLACLPSSTDQLISSFSSGEFNFSSISCFQASSFALDSIQERTNADQFISENFFICSLTSFGIESVIDTILSVNKHKYVKLFKPFAFDNGGVFNKSGEINNGI